MNVTRHRLPLGRLAIGVVAILSMFAAFGLDLPSEVDAALLVLAALSGLVASWELLTFVVHMIERLLRFGIKVCARVYVIEAKRKRLAKLLRRMWMILCRFFTG